MHTTVRLLPFLLQGLFLFYLLTPALAVPMGNGPGGPPETPGRMAVKLISQEEQSATTSANVRARFSELGNIVSAMLHSGMPGDEVLSRDAGMKIKNDLQANRLEEAARATHEAILRLKEYFASRSLTTKPVSQGDAPALAVETARLAIDYEQPQGNFSDYLFGMLGSPFYDERGFRAAKEVGFKMIQLHVPIGFPDPPDLANLEKFVRATLNADAYPLIWFTMPPTGVPVASLQRECLQVLARLHHINPTLQYLFRIGNEPDNAAFWQKSREEFFRTYAGLANTIKRFNSAYIVGGISLMYSCAPLPPFAMDCNRYSSWLVDFLDFLVQSQTPLDFLSIHGYSPVSYEVFSEATNKAAQLLQNKKYHHLSPLYGKPKLANDEWNFLIGDFWTKQYHEEFDTAWAAAGNTMAWIAMVHNGLWLSVCYSGTFNDLEGTVSPARGHDFPLVDLNFRPKPTYYAFKAINSLAGGLRIQVTGSDYYNLAATASFKDGTFYILLACFDIDSYMRRFPDKITARMLASLKERKGIDRFTRYGGYKIQLRNLPWQNGENLHVEQLVVDEWRQLSVMNSEYKRAAASITLRGKITTPAVYLFRITPATESES